MNKALIDELFENEIVEIDEDDENIFSGEEIKDNDEIKRSVLIFCLLGIIYNKDSIENIFKKIHTCLIRKTIAIEEWNLISSFKKNYLEQNYRFFSLVFEYCYSDLTLYIYYLRYYFYSSSLNINSSQFLNIR
jgi:hypothetical protein